LAFGGGVTMLSSLKDAIDELYQAFARSTPASVDGCSHCTDKRELDRLVEKPLKELTAPELDDYAFSVLNTIGSEEDLRYFWPRIVELAVSGELLSDLEVVFGKPDEAGWREKWSARERAATERVAVAILENIAINGTITFGEIDSWVCALSRILDDLPARLGPLLSGTEIADATVFDLVDANRAELARGRLENPFWDSSTPNYNALIDWLQSPAVRAAAERGAAASSRSVEGSQLR
jgi:hypothetical protein